MRAHEETFEERLDLGTWRALARYARPYRAYVARFALAAVAVAAADVGYPLVTGRLIDAVGRDGAGVPFGLYGAVYLGLALTTCAGVRVFVRNAGRVRAGISHDVRADGFANLQRLSFSYFDRRPVGWLVSRMTSDCDRLSFVLAWGVLDLVWGATIMGGIAVVMLWLDWRLALVCLGVLPVLAWVSVSFARRILASARQVRRTSSRITAAYSEGLAGVRTSKVFGREREDQHEFGVLAEEMHAASLRNRLQSALYLPLVMTLGSLATGMALALGGLDVGDRITIGTLVVFLTYTARFFEPIQEMAHWFAEMQMAQASAERILGLIAERPEIEDAPEVRRALRAGRDAPRPAGLADDGLPDAIGRIELAGVWFAYAGGEPVVRGVDLDVRAGETVALVGPTGGGKSTLVNLLCRFYEPTAGEVRIDGVDYRRRGLAWLQSNLGIVLQEPHLFSGTIAENIRYGRLEATDAEVEEAARVVGAHDFVERSPAGYATEVGEGGNLLSTGQKQLVSFARAVLARPRILVMDEATSSVDAETEARIQAALGRVLTGRTSFVIAHRLSTIRAADRILVVAGGRIVEQGDHDELMSRRGRYFDLYTRQSLREAGAWTTTPAGEPGQRGASSSPLSV